MLLLSLCCLPTGVAHVGCIAFLHQAVSLFSPPPPCGLHGWAESSECVNVWACWRFPSKCMARNGPPASSGVVEVPCGKDLTSLTVLSFPRRPGASAWPAALGLGRWWNSHVLPLLPSSCFQIVLPCLSFSGEISGASVSAMRYLCRGMEGRHGRGGQALGRPFAFPAFALVASVIDGMPTLLRIFAQQGLCLGEQEPLTAAWHGSQSVSTWTSQTVPSLPWPPGPPAPGWGVSHSYHRSAPPLGLHGPWVRFRLPQPILCSTHPICVMRCRDFSKSVSFAILCFQVLLQIVFQFTFIWSFQWVFRQWKQAHGHKMFEVSSRLLGSEKRTAYEHTPDRWARAAK